MENMIEFESLGENFGRGDTYAGFVNSTCWRFGSMVVGSGCGLGQDFEFQSCLAGYFC